MPARTSSSTTVPHKPAYAAGSPRVLPFTINRATACRSSSARWSATDAAASVCSRKHPDTYSLTGFVPAAFLAGLLLGPVLASLVPVLWWVYTGAIALYAVLVLIASLALTIRQREPVLLPLLPLVFATVHLGAGTGQCWELLHPSPQPPPRSGEGEEAKNPSPQPPLRSGEGEKGRRQSPILPLPVSEFAVKESESNVTAKAA